MRMLTQNNPIRKLPIDMFSYTREGELNKNTLYLQVIAIAQIA